MKKIIMLTSVLFLFLMSSFASADSLVKKIQVTNPTELTGTITYKDLEGGQYFISTETGNYALLGKKNILKISLGKKVHVTGEIVELEYTYLQRGNGFFEINAITILEGEKEILPEEPVIEEPVITPPVVKEPIKEPVKEPIKTPKPIEVTPPTELKGKLVIDYIEGKHFELVTPKGSFVLVGETAGLDKMVNKQIHVKGTFTKGAITIWQKGEVFIVGAWSEIKTDVPPVKTPEPVTKKPIITKPVVTPEPIIEKPVVTPKPVITKPVITPKPVTAKPIVKKTPVEKEVVTLPFIDRNPVKKDLITEPKNKLLIGLPTIPKQPIKAMSEPIKKGAEKKVVLKKAVDASHFSFSVLEVSHFSAKKEQTIIFKVVK